MSKVTINGQRVDIPMPPVMTDQQLRSALIAAALCGDLYTCAICEIALHGFPRTRTWEQLVTQLKQQLHREYLSADGVGWQRERAQLVMQRRALGGAV